MLLRGKIVIAIMCVAATFAMAQASAPRRLPRKPSRTFFPVTGPAAVRPTTVSGEGTTTPSGLRYWDLAVGTGDPVKPGKAVKVSYTAWVEAGKKFDSSADQGHPLIFLLGAGQVIKGLDEGVAGMRVGGKRQLHIPPHLGFARTASDLVSPNSVLIYEVEVIGAQ